MLLTIVELALLAGCGPQTGDANDLVHQAGDIIGNVSTQVAQADALLDQAAAQSNLRQFDTEKATLRQAQDLLNSAIPQIESAKSKIDEAMGLNISDAYRDYLRAKDRALEAALLLRQTQNQKTDLLLADPGFDSPDTQKKFAELQKTEAEQNKNVQDAENAADQIANDHPDEIK